MISVDPAVLAELESDNFIYCHLVALPGGLFFTDHGQDVSYNGDVYVSNGILLKTSAVVRERGLKAHTHQVTLSAVDGTLYDLYAATDQTKKIGSTYKALLDASGNIISNDPILEYRGTLDMWTLNEAAPNSTMVLKFTNKWAAMMQTAGKLSNPDSQESDHPGDKFFEFSYEEKKNLGWGAK